MCASICVCVCAKKHKGTAERTKGACLENEMAGKHGHREGTNNLDIPHILLADTCCVHGCVCNYFLCYSLCNFTVAIAPYVSKRHGKLRCPEEFEKTYVGCCMTKVNQKDAF